MTTQPDPHPPDRQTKPTFVLTDHPRALVLGANPAAGRTEPPSRWTQLPSVPARIAVPFMAAVVTAMTLLALFALFANRPEPIPTTELAPAAIGAGTDHPTSPGPDY